MTPELLKQGDIILIIAPAKRIEQKYVDYAVSEIERRGFNAIVSPHCLGQYNYFSGNIEDRLSDFQWAIHHQEAKAIVCARGGYGCVHLIERASWYSFQQQPKWLLGFSDVTVFHQYISRFGHASIHGTMPLNFEDNTEPALEGAFKIMTKGLIEHCWESVTNNKPGVTSGKIIGGNLTVLSGLIGTRIQPDYKGKILFIEDVGEPLYATDRNFYQLEMAGILDEISGLIVGSFSEIKDTNPSYNSTLEEVVKSHFNYRSIPIAFNFPGGHIDDNRPVLLGETATLDISLNNATLRIGQMNV